MVKFVNQKFLAEDLTHQGIMVLDTDLQGSWDTGDLKVIKKLFPKIYINYLRMCLNPDLYKPGTAALLEDNGCKIGLLFTKRNRKTSKELVISNFEEAVIDLFKLTPSDLFLYSPVLGRKDKCFTELMLKMAKLTFPERRNWFIYRENGRDR